MAAYTTINKPSLYFNTKLTTGTGNSQAVTGLGFQPDWIWGKRRDSTGNHSLFDAVRGITKGLETNNTGAEFTSTDYYSSFDSDGFTIAAGAGGAGNGNGNTAVQWCWKANGAGSSNTDGSQSSTVSVNTTAGFSIVKYTGYGAATYGHGLGTTPQMIIIKKLNSSDDWFVYHHKLLTPSATQKQFILLNSTAAFASNGSATTFTSVSNSTFGVGTDDKISESGDSFIAYCFAEKKGYSKFGTYTGNGNADGTFVYTGFKPQLIIFKNSSITQHWLMMDTKRDPFNVMDTRLYPSQNNADTTNAAYYVDYLSNGFKIRTNSVSWNGNGNNIIYMAFAENPIVDSTGKIPATAR